MTINNSPANIHTTYGGTNDIVANMSNDYEHFSVHNNRDTYPGPDTNSGYIESWLALTCFWKFILLAALTLVMPVAT